MRRRLKSTLLGALAATALAAAPAQASFGLAEAELQITGSDGSAALRAGTHPFALNTRLAFNAKLDSAGNEVPDGSVKNLEVDLPPGLVGTPNPVPRCPDSDFIDVIGGCADSTRIGTAKAIETTGVYNLYPGPGVAARFGFLQASVPVIVEARLNPNPPHNILATISGAISQVVNVRKAVVDLWGVPADPLNHPSWEGEERLPKLPFFTLPRSCAEPLETIFRADSWEHPGAYVQSGSIAGSTSACSELGFEPEVSTQASTDRVSSPSGLDFSLDIEDEGLSTPGGTALSDIKRTEVALPEGMTANPSFAEGIVPCSEADLAREGAFSQPGEGCPQAAKIGSVEAETPLLEGTLVKGDVFIATPDDPDTAARENPFDSLIALYLVLREPKLGISVKLAGKVTPDPLSGRLVTSFGEPGHELPQLPIGHFRVHIREGARSPLITPPSCGAHATTVTFTPWADPSRSVIRSAALQIDKGSGGGPCPAAGQPFEPGFEAGTANNDAGAHSTLLTRVTRRDGDQDLTRIDLRLPPGLTATLAGVSQCPQAQIAVAKAKSGRAELASPSCPANSRIGTVTGGAGVGSELTYVDGSLYLGGPFNGAPASAVAIVPAVAGPFDVGTVVVHFALRIDPRSGQATVDGAASDPLPHILAGIPLSVRDVRASVDRPGFVLNPTNCAPLSIGASLWGGGANVFSALDDSPLARSAHYQAADCANLGFAPRLTLQLRGGTGRGAFPRLHLVYRPRPGQANLRRLSLRFPRSEFIEQGHFRTICTRVQFAAGPGNGANCPRGSIYGRARIYTPLLDDPVSGPVFLRSSDHNLPDVVLALKGPPSLPVPFEVPARIDSIRGGLRAIAQATPDLPVSAAVIDMQGGQKGLFVNSTNICRAKHRANVAMLGQNGRRFNAKPLLHAASCKKKQRQQRRRNRAHGRVAGR